MTIDTEIKMRGLNALTNSLGLVRGNPGITREEMAASLGISVNGVKQHIKKLKEDGVLQRVGSHRSGCWKIT